jgi:hypothetical protein
MEPTRIQQFTRKGEQWLQKKFEIGAVEGIALVDMYEYTPYFCRTMSAAVHLIRDNDPRRFRRLRAHIKSIVNATRAFGGAAYLHETNTCEIDFQPRPQSEHEVQFYAAWYACTLVHESTHGLLRSRGIPYTPENRNQSEKLCMTEEARFARHLKIDPQVLSWLEPKLKFDPARWHEDWTASRWQQFIRAFRRIRSRHREDDQRRRADWRY